MGANLVGANLAGTDLRKANLSGTKLKGVNLTEAKLLGTTYNDDTDFPIGFGAYAQLIKHSR
jgi:uncharacterized protein YjbI with pentapeptide repeats